MRITKVEKRQKIKYRIRKKVSGTGEIPRLSVFKSNTGIYCQLIDDLQGRTLCAASSKDKAIQKATKSEMAKSVGGLIASKAQAMNIQKIVFDRGGFIYHGRVKALAEGAREGGLQF